MRPVVRSLSLDDRPRIAFVVVFSRTRCGSFTTYAEAVNRERAKFRRMSDERFDSAFDSSLIRPATDISTD